MTIQFKCFRELNSRTKRLGQNTCLPQVKRYIAPVCHLRTVDDVRQVFILVRSITIEVATPPAYCEVCELKGLHSNLTDDDKIAGQFVGRHLQVEGGGALADAPGDVVVRAVARAVVAAEIACIRTKIKNYLFNKRNRYNYDPFISKYIPMARKTHTGYPKSAGI